MRGFKPLLFAAITLFLLLLPNAQAATQHASLPPGPFFVFSFPDYTSLHDCSFFQGNEQPLSAKACIDMLKKEQKMAGKDTEYTQSDFFRTFIGEFGNNPLLYDKASILHCEGDCRELKPHRSGPPEMMWRPPEIDKQKSRLVYPLSHAVPRTNIKLSLLLADGEWRSNLFAGDFWYHNYMRVYLDKTTHTLIVERNWGKTLGDSTNHVALWRNVSMFVLTWLAILLLAVPGLLLAKWRYRWRWKQGGRILLRHATTLMLAIIFVTFAMFNSPGGVLALPAYLLVYFLAMLPEWWLSKRHGKLESRHILIALMLMRLPFTLFLIMTIAYS